MLARNTRNTERNTNVIMRFTPVRNGRIQRDPNRLRRNRQNRNQQSQQNRQNQNQNLQNQNQNRQILQIQNRQNQNQNRIQQPPSPTPSHPSQQIQQSIIHDLPNLIEAQDSNIIFQKTPEYFSSIEGDIFSGFS
ncbi:uncharacterized protein OCT59_010762 [Rhizophagus irregularis]|uniref:Uncharacterized protein n=1 Tax=Rhizophagus irregularis (strain DAOM 181602 / DAOM 197198 / MUCL 43194) TaxID=747089 RepID=U9TBC9_RHIID|nr:hypothetical protein GLOIN_2v1772449 [Rhizophagus irregularis DAOM 181602=DAOM 197198]POG73576.1 hypothetical protein GLOIN_2v1772449 [Rhizophagus irregularis DAOM 181602=DAOM 197198]UZO19473.1 hypothetical protein OCT59_010762 [Rhizophagus irregularis]GET52187.1 hypothetical protein GLOIN_2v1772449 [Rhizophagus irregularis DAOM 181602=DAOM 197198]|eukprot:XP_025180442.1 hypothetical protein GLOIN_2v1772449 [Rhizophagus irregularis DAOM 181602=DAOM 197198]